MNESSIKASRKDGSARTRRATARLRTLRLLAARCGKDALDHRLEVRQRKRLVGRVERRLIPLVGELASPGVPRLVLVLVARFGVFVHERVVMPALKILVRANDLVGLARH